MKKLFQIVKEKDDLQNEKLELTQSYKKKCKELDEKIDELKRLENIGQDGLDLDKIQMAEKIIYCHGNPHDPCEGKVLTELAAIDIANDHPHLSKKYFGNKRYSGFYQRTDCSYGMGPSHGGIVDEVGMKEENRGQMLCDEEKDACIYYLKNYAKIKALKSHGGVPA